MQYKHARCNCRKQALARFRYLNKKNFVSRVKFWCNWRKMKNLRAKVMAMYVKVSKEPKYYTRYFKPVSKFFFLKTFGALSTNYRELKVNIHSEGLFHSHLKYALSTSVVLHVDRYPHKCNYTV